MLASKDQSILDRQFIPETEVRVYLGRGALTFIRPSPEDGLLEQLQRLVCLCLLSYFYQSFF